MNCKPCWIVVQTVKRHVNTQMELPDRNTDYRDQSYWDDRYSKEKAFDWFSDYEAFKHLLKDDIKTADKILILGCGNSLMSEHMYQDGFLNITNTDYSPVVIENMRNKCQQKYPGMSWEVMDILNMTYEPETFDVVLEKGTLDALMVHEKDPWNISEETEKTIENVLTQVRTVLKADGKFISVTFAQPHFRKPHYARTVFDWSVEQKHFGQNFHYYYYVMQKGSKLSVEDITKENERTAKKLQNMTEEDKTIEYLEYEDNENFLNGIEL
ncbi:EEF1AKMT4 [Mytilus edulis]|uniref:EEF1A lysine methyltransferase 4 n=1 Tax=Mytilus edulis TaxID=6550 RepID=A0A8S3UPN9_MYTED|nr:EEF1AKMT4 [Mytilus edulis]